MEALVLLLVPIVALAVYLAARFQAQGAPRTVAQQIEQLHQQLAWHEHRLRHAREKNWDHDMIRPIIEELDDTRFQLAQVTAAQTAASRRNPAS